MAARILFILATLYTLLILILSLVQLGEISVGDFHPTDKIMHVSAYFGLAFIWFFYILFKKSEDYHYQKTFFIVSLLIVLFGILIEALQGALTSYRQPDWADILANTIGVVIALAFFFFFRKFLRRVKHHINSFL